VVNGGGSGEIDEPRVTHRFSIGIQAAGTFKPGMPITLTATVQAALPAREAQVWIILPELEAERILGRVGDRRRPVNVELPRAIEVRQGLARGARFSLTATVIVPEPGIYRAIAGVATRSREPVVDSGAYVQNVRYDERWFVVDSAGGRIVERYDDVLLPTGTQSGAGRFSLKATVGAPGTDAAEAPPTGGLAIVVPPPDGGPATYTVTTSYYNSDALRFESLPYIGYILDRHEHSPEGWTYAVQAGNADSTGTIVLPCPATASSSYRITLRYLVPDVFHLHPDTARIQETLTNLCGISGGSSTLAMSVDRDSVARIFVNLKATVPASRAFFGRQRGGIQVDFNPADPISFYLTSDDKIRINRDATFSDYGVFVVAHEYGHAMHEKALGGIPFSGGACPSSHYLELSSVTLGCAFREGFADFHGAVTRGTAAGRLYDIVTSNYYGTLPGSNDGSVFETSVAKFLYDLTDGSSNNEPWDRAQYPGSYVGSVIKSCSVQAGIWAPADGVDHLAYCFEQQVDPSVRLSFFPTRAAPPTAESQSAVTPATWSRDDIRALWLRDLYNQSPPPPSTPLQVTLDGPSMVRPQNTCTWIATPAGGVAPYHYEWTLDDVIVGTNSNFSSANLPAGGHYVKITLSDAANSVTSATLGITSTTGAPSCIQ
jgi:hypothetical protein